MAEEKSEPMAGISDEAEVEEYESDPEEAKLSLAMRRREASDDEEEERDDDDDKEMHRRRIDPRVQVRGSDTESDDVGAAAEYDDDEEDLEIEEEEVVDAEEEENNEFVPEVKVAAAAEVGIKMDGDDGRSVGESTVKVPRMENEGEEEEDKKVNEEGSMVPTVDGGFCEDQYQDTGDDERGEGEGEEEKKENEPFAVPTAGAFYMHDDRFRDSAGGRHRRTLGGRKLWESKDDRKWGHDKFEEMSMQERHSEEGRRGSRGRYRPRWKNRVEEQGYPRGDRPKSNNSNQNNGPKTVRGRGPRRYQPSNKLNNEAPAQYKQSGKSAEKTSYAISGRISTPTPNVNSDPVPARKNVVASSLNSASPPFYPSSNKETVSTQRRDAQPAPINRNQRSSVTDENFPLPHSNAMRGKNVSGCIGMDKLYIDDSVSSRSGSSSTNMHLQPSGSSLMNSIQSPHSRVQGRGLTPLGQMAYQTAVPNNQGNKVSRTNQLHTFQRAPVQNRLQTSLQASGQQLGGPGSGSQASSPPRSALSVNSFESGEMESPSESSKSKTELVGKGKHSIQGSGRGSFPFAGTQVLGASGNMVGSHGDQNFPARFLPVMQFGGQHPGSMGVPAVGMAFPGYVGNPQLGNSEMTWLPVLAGAAGALGTTYCSPYLAVDGGGYHARTSGQTSALPAASSKENSTNKAGDEQEPSHRPELPNDDLGKRQNKTLRYTEMKFDK